MVAFWGGWKATGSFERATGTSVRLSWLMHAAILWTWPLIPLIFLMPPHSLLTSTGLCSTACT